MCSSIQDKDEAILVKNFERDNTFHSEGPKDGQKIWDKCQQDLIREEKQIPELDRPPRSYNWETKTARSHYQKFLSQLSALPSNSVEPTPAIGEAVKDSILETGANEQSWKSVSVSTDDFLFQISFQMWIFMLVDLVNPVALILFLLLQ